MTGTQEFLTFIWAGRHELRVLTGGPVTAQTYTTPEEFAQVAEDIHRGNVYFTINPVRPDAVIPAGQAADAVDIASRSLYLIDVDPDRPSGTASTRGEKREAMAVANTVLAYLAELGWPEPILVDSGNGYHMYLRGDGCDPNDKNWKTVLKHLSDRCSTPGAHVDKVVYNAARISRLPGTRNRKGPDTAERPHRLCKVVSYPAAWTPVTQEMVAQLAESVAPKDAVAPVEYAKTEITDEDMAAFFEAYEDYVTVLAAVQKDKETFYFLESCPFNGGPHKEGHSPRHTCIMHGPEQIGFKCLSDDCADQTFGTLQTLLYEETGIPSPLWHRDCDIEITDEEMALFNCSEAEIPTLQEVEEDDEDYDAPAPVVQAPPSISWQDYDARTAYVLANTAWTPEASAKLLPLLSDDDVRAALRRTVHATLSSRHFGDRYLAKVEAIWSSCDMDKMVAAIPPEELFAYFRDLHRPADAPVSFGRLVDMASPVSRGELFVSNPRQMPGYRAPLEHTSLTSRGHHHGGPVTF